MELTELKVGDKIQRGDLFRGDGKMHAIDKFGRLLGIPVIGETLKKSGDWFRPRSNDQ